MTPPNGSETSNMTPPNDPCSCSRAGCSNYLQINRTIIESTDLYSILREWRTSRIQAILNETGQKIPAYVILTNRTIRDLVHYRPSNEEELLSIHGLGDDKVNRFGPEILERISVSDDPEYHLVMLCDDCDDNQEWIATGSPNPERGPNIIPSGSTCCPTCGREWDGIRRGGSTGSTEPSGPGRPEIITNEIRDLNSEQQQAIPKSGNVLQVEIQAKSLQSIFQAVDEYVKQPTVGLVFDHDEFGSRLTVKPEWVTVRAGGVGYFRQRLAHTISPGGQ